MYLIVNILGFGANLPTVMACIAAISALSGAYKIFIFDARSSKQDKLEAAEHALTEEQGIMIERLKLEIDGREQQLKETNYWREQVPVLRDRVLMLDARIQEDAKKHAAEIIATEQRYTEMIKVIEINTKTERERLEIEKRDLQLVIADLNVRILRLEGSANRP